MSSSTGGKTLSSSRTYHESLSTDNPRLASLSSQLNQYNSQSASPSQPFAGNDFYRDDNHGHNPHHEVHYQSEQIHTPFNATSLPRSSPIAIIRPPGDTKEEIVDCDFDDEDSVIDVEGDAIKLQRKYGNKIIQSYIPDSTLITSNARGREKASVLNAPYLGSLSKSSHQVLSLPPISLAGDSTYIGEPPESILSYGSLRDSHERGRFLDGPSSYREPLSGKIRQLDHRLRYHGRQPELNIGERLQQSRKLKEMRLREESKRKKDELNCDYSEGERNERIETKSSLSAIMRDASQSLNTGIVDVDDVPESNEFSSLERLVPIHQCETTPTQSHINQPPRNMLSTSLTAFELLKSSNTDTLSGCSSVNPFHPVTHLSDTDQLINFKSSAGFQPLARSMSDPLPRFQNLSLSETSTTSVLPGSQTGDLPAHMENSLAGTEQQESYIQIHQGTQDAMNYQLLNNDLYICEQNRPSASGSMLSEKAVMFNSVGHRSQHVDHYPSIDGAFGDMDM
mmetsp:Transcript_3790/g.9939  ORF Transcript_3790/g.9939 Transcript_3790/m.9939 type:complete len:510 (-) Transcript_3790:209-1738(-)|eukprot:CAMPEP_0197190148 /NCGR_PEP_ID=MMETSP1423-20130617/21073_1 /TAXON_ID=476441 /ORGANISM="Pseudo-nitzschia heimii, Strain UNC1101" /LENGTH=509 /DNA_ID=CAMNT_0042642461 /DNA_START=110 /DNA_END=1639 /DNA_ORIENTATION=-